MCKNKGGGLQCTAPMLLLVSTLEVWTVCMGTNLGSTLDSQFRSCSWEAALVVSLSPVGQASLAENCAFHLLISPVRYLIS
jgi:hypothetical protein